MRKGFIKKHWLFLSLGLICVVIFTYILKGLHNLPQEATLEKILLKDGVRLSQVHYSQGDINKDLNWKLDAEEVRLSRDNNIVTFKKFHLIVEPKGKPKINLEGQKGEYSRVTGVLNLWGDIRVSSGNGYSAKSGHLVLDEKKGFITTKDWVEISGPFFSLTGKGLFVDLKREVLKIRANVTTKVKGELLAS